MNTQYNVNNSKSCLKIYTNSNYGKPEHKNETGVSKKNT